MALVIAGRIVPMSSHMTLRLCSQVESTLGDDGFVEAVTAGDAARSRQDLQTPQ